MGRRLVSLTGACGNARLAADLIQWPDCPVFVDLDAGLGHDDVDRAALLERRFHHRQLIGARVGGEIEAEVDLFDWLGYLGNAAYAANVEFGIERHLHVIDAHAQLFGDNSEDDMRAAGEHGDETVERRRPDIAATTRRRLVGMNAVAFIIELQTGRRKADRHHRFRPFLQRDLAHLDSPQR